MDFKSLINKIDSLDIPATSIAAPELPKAVQLNEDAELRVLAGTSSYVAEAKKAKEEKKEKSVEEGFDDNAKPGDTFKTKTGVATKTKTGLKHERSYEKEKDEDDEDAPKSKKAKKESIDSEAFKNKFAKMVEAAKPDFLDIDKDGNKKESMKKAAKEKKAKPDYSKAMDKMFGGNAEELTKNLTIKKKTNEAEEEKRAPAKKTTRTVDLPSGAKGKITKVQGWQSQKAEKDADKDSKKNESKMMPKGKKRPVKESVEQKLTFKQMVQLVQESGGQQQIDPIDTELFNWATRVAKNKLGEGMQAELYAGLIYERNGGVFQMYDILSESNFAWDKDDFPKKKDRGPRDDGQDELARREKVLGKGGLGKGREGGREYKEKDKYGDMYKIGGPKGKLPEDFDDVEDMEIDDVVSKLENAGAALANAGNKLLALSEKDIDAATASDDGFAIIARALKQISGDYNLQQLITTSASESTESDSDEDEEDEDDYETRYHDQTTWRSGTDWDDHRER